MTPRAFQGFPGVPCHRGGEKPALPVLTPGSGATMGRVRGRPSWSSTTKVMKALLMCLRLTDISWPYASAQTPTSMLGGERGKEGVRVRRATGRVGWGPPPPPAPTCF